QAILAQGLFDRNDDRLIAAPPALPALASEPIHGSGVPDWIQQPAVGRRTKQETSTNQPGRIWPRTNRHGGNLARAFAIVTPGRSSTQGVRRFKMMLGAKVEGIVKARVWMPGATPATVEWLKPACARREKAARRC